MVMLIRAAREDDGLSAVSLLRESIASLCRDDHQDDPAKVRAWLESKTVEAWSVWLNRSDALVLLAERGLSGCAVGMVRSDGEILLNYVSPAYRFQGVSKAMLSALEQEAAARGATSMAVESTRTARRFYVANGYAPERVDDPLRMTKSLSA
jgi:GNAT superfamily N-acetyltransferase